MKKRARRLLREAARLADASTLGASHPSLVGRGEIARLRAEAHELLVEVLRKQADLGRAATHPVTLYTLVASGARPDEPFHEFPGRCSGRCWS